MRSRQKRVMVARGRMKKAVMSLEKSDIRQPAMELRCRCGHQAWGVAIDAAQQLILICVSCKSLFKITDDGLTVVQKAA